MLLGRSPPKFRAWLVGAAVLAVAWAAWAGRLVPVALRSAIIIRSAGYERGFSERSGRAVLAVISGKSGASADDGRAMAGALGKASQIGGRATRLVQITYDPAKTAGELRSQGAEIIYVAEGLEGMVKDIPGQEGGIARIIVCANGADVGGVGCTLGVELVDDKPRIVLNLKQANAVGLRFQPEFLRLARIVR